jgi:co-chaperonin GroES (HSP10)
LSDQTILVKPIKLAEKTASGLYLAPAAVQDSQYHSLTGELIKKAPSSFISNSSGRPWQPSEIPEIGDIILFARYEGTVITGEDGEEYRVLEDKTISGFYKPAKGE